MATKHNDTSEVERNFSLMSHIHQNKQRNSMGQDMLDSYSYSYIKLGVENTESRARCDQ